MDYKAVGFPQCVLKKIQTWKWKIHASEPFEVGVVCEKMGGHRKFKKKIRIWNLGKNFLLEI